MLVLGYADPPSEPRQGGMLDRLAGFATDVYSVFTNLTPANIWNGVQNVWDNVTTFVGNVGEQLRDDPVGLVGTIGAGIRDTGMVLANVFTFGLISPLNRKVGEIIQNDPSGFFRTINVGAIFVREVGLTALTMGAGRVAIGVGTRLVGRLATNLGVSTTRSMTATLFTIGRGALQPAA